MKHDKTDSEPIHSVSYWTGPKAKELEYQEMDRMIGMDVIESTQMEWA